MKGWVGLVGWPVADGLPTLVVTHQLQVERRTGKVRRPETDVLPLCHAMIRPGLWIGFGSGFMVWLMTVLELRSVVATALQRYICNRWAVSSGYMHASRPKTGFPHHRISSRRFQLNSAGCEMIGSRIEQNTIQTHSRWTWTVATPNWQTIAAVSQSSSSSSEADIERSAYTYCSLDLLQSFLFFICISVVLLRFCSNATISRRRLFTRATLC